MKESLLGTSLIAGAALALGVIWVDSAQAFSLGSPVTVTNTLLPISGPPEVPYQGPQTVIVGPGLELEQFGDIWDIDLGNNSILFSINSRIGNVVSGDDIYRFLAPNLGKPGQNLLTGFTVVPLGRLAFNQNPTINLLAGNELEVIFPLGFAQNLASIPDGDLAFRINVTVDEPAPIPTPALLPGLVGMGLAVLRQRRKDG